MQTTPVKQPTGGLCQVVQFCVEECSVDLKPGSVGPEL